MSPKTFHGARAIVKMIGSDNVNRTCGTFSSFSYGLTFDVSPVPILGRHSVAELVYTGAEPVRCNATGWRVIDNGPHLAGGLPHLKDLLTASYIEIIVVDRQDPTKEICRISSVRPESYSTTITAKSLNEMTHSFVGIMVEDESGPNDEAAGAAEL